ncbi:hypothetical protein [Desulfobulbus alkaliphilus]|uniref:hypothetical protein n=1 Tax=Desulfobulbus alkaliphilus TaxID=869814 RepID=UPI001963FA99|nr:hypothetical protein [Desulfobulbus alkaliphilus]MBM9538136.1 hypothetical protein [Desulfobulbus alkaliphilus]
MQEQLRETLQRRLDILREEMASFPEDMGIGPKELLKETMEENLAIAKVDGNQKEIEQFKLALLLIDELE